jgi:multimeric flavodoxin WrbA
MKVVAFNGSPRKGGNTDHLIRHVLASLKEEGIRTEVVQIGGKRIQGCIGCGKCFEMQNRKCAIEHDIINGCIEKMAAADGIIIGSPTYFADVSTPVKALIERAGFVGMANGRMYDRKVGAAVVAVRRAGGIHVFDSINHFFGISGIYIAGSTYWNLGVGLNPGDVEQDEEGIKTMRNLGENMAWILRRIHGS